MDESKLLTLQEAHRRLHAEYLTAHSRHREAVTSATRIEAQFASDLDDNPRGEARVAAARRIAERAAGEAQALAVRLRASRALLDRLNEYAAIN